MPLLSLANNFKIAELAGLSIKATDILFILGWLTLLVHIIITGRISKQLLKFLGLIFLFAALSMLGILFIDNYEIDIAAYGRFIQTILWGGLALAFVKTEKELNYLENSIISSSSIISAFSVYIYLTNPGLHRIAGFFSYSGGDAIDGRTSYNEIGALFALAILLSFRKIITSPPNHPVKINLIRLIFILNIIGLVLDQSRSAALAVAVMFIFLIVPRLKGKLNRQYLISIVTVVLGMIAFYNVSTKLAVNRFIMTFDSSTGAYASASERIDLWQHGLVLWVQNISTFLLGLGNKTFYYVFNSRSTDNFYLDHGLAQGLAGLTVLLILLFWPAGLWQKRKNRLLSIPFMVLIVALIVSVTGNVLVDPYYGGISFILMYGAFSTYLRKEPVVGEG